MYGQSTYGSVKAFQGIFNLPQTGVVDYATWYGISNIYVGVTRIAELRHESLFYPPTNIVNSTRGVVEIPHFSYPKM